MPCSLHDPTVIRELARVNGDECVPILQDKALFSWKSARRTAACSK